MKARIAHKAGNGITGWRTGL